MTRYAFVAFLPALLAWAARGQAGAYPALGFPDSGGHPVSTPLLRPIHAGSVFFVLERTTLPQVRKAFGGQIQHGGDASGAEYWLCYAGQTSAGKPLVYWFVSNAEMASADHSLSGIALQVILQQRLFLFVARLL